MGHWDTCPSLTLQVYGYAYKLPELHLCICYWRLNITLLLGLLRLSRTAGFINYNPVLIYTQRIYVLIKIYK